MISFVGTVMNGAISPEEIALRAYRSFLLTMAAGIGVVVLYALQGRSPAEVVAIATVGVMVAAASLALGGLVGFIFGIPRSLQAEPRPASDQETTSDRTQPLSGSFAHNTSLEQISDWLTKILVGVGLTQLANAPSALAALGGFLAPGLGGFPSAQVFAAGLLIYYALDGFFLGYLWTRLNLPLLFTDALARARLEEARLTGEYQGLEAAAPQLEALRSELAAAETRAQALEAELAAGTSRLAEQRLTAQRAAAAQAAQRLAAERAAADRAAEAAEQVAGEAEAAEAARTAQQLAERLAAERLVAEQIDAARASAAVSAAKAAEAVTPETLQPTADRPESTVRALWVDDRPENNRREMDVLHRSLGVEFETKKSTREALVELQTHPSEYDFVISDMGRPGDRRAGYTLLNELQDRGLNIPFIIYSGVGGPEVDREAQSRGAKRSTNSPSVLFDTVTDILREKSSGT
jgi:CheY-like chemotaxis protein